MFFELERIFVIYNLVFHRMIRHDSPLGLTFEQICHFAGKYFCVKYQNKVNSSRVCKSHFHFELVIIHYSQQLEKTFLDICEVFYRLYVKPLERVTT